MTHNLNIFAGLLIHNVKQLNSDVQFLQTQINARFGFGTFQLVYGVPNTLEIMLTDGTCILADNVDFEYMMTMSSREAYQYLNRILTEGV